MSTLEDLLREVRACTACAAHLPLGPNPVLRAAATARILIVGQAPGTRVHETGIPWNDPSGNRLRDWLQGFQDNPEERRYLEAGEAVFRRWHEQGERRAPLELGEMLQA